MPTVRGPMNPRTSPSTALPGGQASRNPLRHAADKKHQGNRFVRFGRAYGIATSAQRFFNVFRPPSKLREPARVSQPYPLAAGRRAFEGERHTRAFIEVRDVARLLLMAVTSSETVPRC